VRVDHISASKPRRQPRREPRIAVPLQIRTRTHHLRLDAVRASELQARRRRVSRQQPRPMPTLSEGTRDPQERKLRTP
jgi:hypothetical protein